jgi:hypothetical protein
LKDAARQFFDGGLGALVGGCLDEGETSRAPGFPVQRDSNTAYLNTLGREGVPKFLLVDVVGEVADEKARTHLT